MRLTAETYQRIAQSQTRGFVSRGADFLESRFHSFISNRQIERSSLECTIKDSYDFTVENGRPSELLAVRIACAKLCFGSFFLNDIRYVALKEIVNQQLECLVLTDDDPIFSYILKYKADWTMDWFLQKHDYIWTIAASRQVIPQGAPEWLDGMGVIEKLFEVEERSTTLIPELGRRRFFELLERKAYDCLPVEAGEQARVLLTIGQFYDGYNCFNDPLRPRWYGVLNPDDMELTRWQIQKVYTPEQGN
ncbi:MAG: hypothetical protein LBN41_10205 [Enterobacteriaceae bacterium]|jgi:hypothetical protein|nr:hypothetical protein [Enterobacteriaceae bacterium]